jgi:thioredoxin-dependent peroxiredoxin
MTAKLKEGDKAPDFALPDAEGVSVRLHDLLEQGPVMLVFYPADHSPVCTTQLCSYRDTFPQFRALGIQIVGISTDSPEKHAAFQKDNALPFPLLADTDAEVSKKWAGTSFFTGGRANRANFVIDREGTIRYAHQEVVGLLHRKPDELLDVIKTVLPERRTS